MCIYLIYVCHLCELSIKNSSQSVSSFRTYSTDAFAFGWLRCAWLEEKSMYDKWRLEDSQPLQSTIIFFISDIGNDYVLEIVNGWMSDARIITASGTISHLAVCHLD